MAMVPRVGSAVLAEAADEETELLPVLHRVVDGLEPETFL
jgi:hypothetical protein